MPTTTQGAAKSFQLPQRTCCRQKSLLSCTFQVIWVYCVSKYSRASPGYRKVDLKLHLPTPRGPFFKDVLLRPDYSWGCLFHLLQIPKLLGNLHQRWNYQGFLSRPLTLVRGGQTSVSRFKGRGRNRFPSGAQPTLRVRRATSHPGYRLEKEALTSTPLQPSRPQVPRPSRIYRKSRGLREEWGQGSVKPQLAEKGKLAGGRGGRSWGTWPPHFQEISQEGRGNSGKRTPESGWGYGSCCPPGSSPLSCPASTTS